jgi:uncharacterized protein (DUF2267 family)
VSRWLADVRPVDPEDAVQTVFTVLARHVPQGQMEKVLQALPEDLRAICTPVREENGLRKKLTKARG